MARRLHTAVDRLLIEFDHGLRTLVASAPAPGRPSPATPIAEAEPSETEQRHISGLMGVNHPGEVCGQALTAKLPAVRREMAQTAEEEIGHLAWCEQRLQQLDSQPSALNPLQYSLSFGIGAGLISDQLGLGFVAATEDQVCKHLQNHLQQLPPQDQKSR